MNVAENMLLAIIFFYCLLKTIELLSQLKKYLYIIFLKLLDSNKNFIEIYNTNEKYSQLLIYTC